MPQDYDGAGRADLGGRGQHVQQHGLAADGVKDLGQVGLHALALAGGQHDDGRDQEQGGSRMHLGELETT